MRWRLVAAFVGIVLVVLAAHDIPLALHLQRVERDRLLTGLERDAFVIAGHAEEALERGSAVDDDGVQAFVDAYRADAGARVVVTDASGVAVAISDEEVSAGTDYASRPEVAEALAGAPVTGERDSATLGFRLLYVAVPVLSGDSVVGAVRLTYPAAEIGRRVSARVRSLLVVAGMSILTAAIVAVALAATFSRPIRRLRAATDILASGDLSIAAPTSEGPSEVRALAQAFNTMSTRMRGLIDDQRAFAGDASHQLRTPLTALRLRLDQAAEIVDTDPAAARQRIEAASAEAERLGHLVDGLLALARAEGRDTPRDVVDLGAIASERTEVWQPLAEELGIRLTFVGAPGALVRAVPGAAEQIVDNFIDNALAATPAGGTIEVAVETDDESPARVSTTGAGRHGVRFAVHVRDTGAGMTDEQIASAFNRFWRAGGSPASGSGLGLAIVAQLCRASGGSARLSNRPGGGLEATAVFDAADVTSDQRMSTSN